MPRSLRVLVTFAGGRGHLAPLLPLADALQAAGHAVALTGQRELVDREAGPFAAAFPDEDDRRSDGDQSTGELMPPDLAHEFEVIGRYYAGRLGQARLARVGTIIDRWRPEVVICDEMDFGALAAAERAGIPRVVVCVIASGALTRAAYVQEPVNALRAQAGLGPDIALTSLAGDLTIAPFPPSFRDPSFPLPTGALSIQPDRASRTSERSEAVEWLTRAGTGVPRIYFTLGTVFNTESGDLMGRVTEGLGALDARVLVTVGTNVDPASVAQAPPHVRVERFVPHSAVLPAADLVVSHGGSGSVIGALAQGVPTIVLPMGADQELNAERLTALGAGVSLNPLDATAEQVRATAAGVLADHRMASRAGALRAEIRGLPPVTAAIAPIERLARARTRPSG